MVSRKSSQVFGTAEQSGPSEPGILLVGLEPVKGPPVHVTGAPVVVTVPLGGVAALAASLTRARTPAASAAARRTRVIALLLGSSW